VQLVRVGRVRALLAQNRLPHRAVHDLPPQHRISSCGMALQMHTERGGEGAHDEESAVLRLLGGAGRGLDTLAEHVVTQQRNHPAMLSCH